MDKVFHPANPRGKADCNWYNAKYPFCFASNPNPNRLQQRLLRGLRDNLFLQKRTPKLRLPLFILKIPQITLTTLYLKPFN